MTRTEILKWLRTDYDPEDSPLAEKENAFRQGLALILEAVCPKAEPALLERVRNKVQPTWPAPYRLLCPPPADLENALHEALALMIERLDGSDGLNGTDTSFYYCFETIHHIRTSGTRAEEQKRTGKHNEEDA